MTIKSLRIRMNLPFLFCAVLLGISGCDDQPSKPRSASGITKASVKVPVGPDGLTAEQRNISKRLTTDNEPGAIKHLYVISPYSGQVLIYSTVKGKVTSGGKRLTPTTVNGGYNAGYYGGFRIDIGGIDAYTNEVLQDDGTYGISGEYLYWWDTKDVAHEHRVTGGQIIHISSEPLAIKSVVINMEISPPANHGLEAAEPLKNPSSVSTAHP